MENNGAGQGHSVKYPRSYDIIYRSGYVISFLGIFLFWVSYLFLNESGLFGGISLFYIGALISGIFLLVWRKEIKIFILSCIIIGIFLSFMYLFLKNQEILIVSIGFVLAGYAGLYGKEAYCFHFNEGWILMWSFPVLIFTNLIIYGTGYGRNVITHDIFSVIYLIIVILALSFLIKKLRQPIMEFCQNQ